MTTWESAGLPRLGKPRGAVRCGAAEREAEVESTSYGEGEHQPAKTEREARGRTEQQIAGQGTSDGDGEHEPVKTQRPAGQSRGNPHGAGRRGAMERETEAERGTGGDEGEQRAANTDKKARG